MKTQVPTPASVKAIAAAAAKSKRAAAKVAKVRAAEDKADAAAAAKVAAKSKAAAAKAAAEIKSAIRAVVVNGAKGQDDAAELAEVLTCSRGTRGTLDSIALESFPNSRPLALGEFVVVCYGVGMVIGKGGHCAESRPVCNDPRKLPGVQVGFLKNADGSKSKRIVVMLAKAGKDSDNLPEWGLQSSDNGATWQVAIRASDAAWTHKKRLLPVPFDRAEIAWK